MEKIKMSSLIKNKNSQKQFLVDIFEENSYIWLKKREIEKIFALRVSFKDVKNLNDFSTIDELICAANFVPGDIQRDLRTFYDNFKKYGLEKKDKTKTQDLMYRWNPISIEKLNTIVNPVARQLFKNQKEIDTFLKNKNYTCEMCNISKFNNEVLRIAIDHWRAHSIYNIDDKNIAILLCEKCNNIHHNFDASKILLKYKDNIKIIKNWIHLEKKIQQLGFYPNKVDLECQKKVILEINEYHSCLNPLNSNFWEGLF